MKKMNRSLNRMGFVVLMLLLLAPTAQSQLQQTWIKVHVATENSDWTYSCGERVKFKVSVTKNSIPIEQIAISYEVGPEKMEATKKGNEVLKNGTMVINGGSLSEPGFLRCTVTAEYEGKKYTGMATAGFEPEQIKPTAELPEDFVSFWQEAKAEAAKIPMNPIMKLLPERCTEKVDVYEINIQNFRPGSRLYGILSVPKGEGKYPAILLVPGAGIRPYAGDVYRAERGIITLQIGIHGIPVTLDQSVYTTLGNGALYNYSRFNLDDKDSYYYKRVYLGCVRAIDFLFSLPQFDGVNLAVSGGSQGGALSIVTAALDDRIKGLVSFYPALCDLTGYLHNRAGGWPHMFNGADPNDPKIKKQVETSSYYDVVNFARFVKVPGFYSWGYNDLTCPPSSFYSAYNVITAPKELSLFLETGHWTYPEQWEQAYEFLYRLLGN